MHGPATRQNPNKGKNSLNAKHRTPPTNDQEQEDAINLLLSQTPVNAAKKPNRQKTPTDPELTNRRTLEAGLMASVHNSLQPLIEKALMDCIPTIVTQISGNLTKMVEKAVNDAVGNAMQNIYTEMDILTNNVRHLAERSELMTLCETDNNQQYSRRDNVKIFGLTENRDENLNNIIIEIAKLMGVVIIPSDISTCHRLPLRKGEKGTKPVIVRFSRRDARSEFYMNKKALKSEQALKTVGEIYVNDDLTAPRSRAVAKLRRDPGIERVWTTGGTINFISKSNQGYDNSNRVTIRNICDFQRTLGWDYGTLFDLFQKGTQLPPAAPARHRPFPVR